MVQRLENQLTNTEILNTSTQHQYTENLSVVYTVHGFQDGFQAHNTEILRPLRPHPPRRRCSSRPRRRQAKRCLATRAAEPLSSRATKAEEAEER